MYVWCVWFWCFAPSLLQLWTKVGIDHPCYCTRPAYTKLLSNIGKIIPIIIISSPSWTSQDVGR